MKGKQVTNSQQPHALAILPDVGNRIWPDDPQRARCVILFDSEAAAIRWIVAELCRSPEPVKFQAGRWFVQGGEAEGYDNAAWALDVWQECHLDGCEYCHTVPVVDLNESSVACVEPSEVVFEFNRAFTTRAQLTVSRRKAIQQRAADPDWAETWREALQLAARLPFCRGENDRGWCANLTWFVRPNTVTEILEGKYGKLNQINHQAARTENANASAFRIFDAAVSGSSGADAVGGPKANAIESGGGCIPHNPAST